MRLDVVRGAGALNEWCVTVDGIYVVGFAGPDARDRALQHREELELRLTAAAESPAEERAAEPDSEAPAPPLWGRAS